MKIVETKRQRRAHWKKTAPQRAERAGALKAAQERHDRWVAAGTPITAHYRLRHYPNRIHGVDLAAVTVKEETL